jgi:hypothetical protein
MWLDKHKGRTIVAARALNASSALFSDEPFFGKRKRLRGLCQAKKLKQQIAQYVSAAHVEPKDDIDLESVTI